MNKKRLLLVTLLFLVSALTFLPLIWRIGYMNDDWYLMYSAGAYGPKVFMDIFSVDRPVRALVMIPAYILFGENPLYYNLSAYVFRVLSALGLFWLLQLVWRGQTRFAFLVSLLYLVYPGFLSQLNGIDYQPQLVSLAAAMVSIVLSVKVVLAKHARTKFLMFALSILLGWLYLGLVEYFIGFELLRLSSLFILAIRMGGQWKDKMIRGFKFWLPNIFTPLLFFVWRTFFFQSERDATDISIQFEQIRLYPIQTLYHWALQVSQDLIDVVITAWYIPLSQLIDYIKPWGGVLAVVLAGITLYAFYHSKSKTGQETSANAFTREAFVLGVFMVVGGLLPIAMVNRDVSFPSYSRYSLVGSVGVAILFGSALIMIKQRSLRNGLIALLIFISVLTHHANTVKAVQQTAATNNFWWQISWRIPHLEKNTTLIANYPGAIVEEDYFVWGPANLIYFPDKQNENDIQPGVFAALLNTNTVEKVLARERQEYDKRKNIITYANYRNVLVMTQPGVNSCVHVIDGMQPEYSPGELDLIREVEPYSEIEHVLKDETPHPPPTVVFGPEPDHGWCYYYQKADLARQRGEWENVRRIGEQAFDQDFEPKDPIEWMPFLQAYAAVGDTERLTEAAFVISNDPNLSSQACQIIGSMSDLPLKVINTVNRLLCQD